VIRLNLTCIYKGYIHSALMAM